MTQITEIWKSPISKSSSSAKCLLPLHPKGDTTIRKGDFIAGAGSSCARPDTDSKDNGVSVGAKNFLLLKPTNQNSAYRLKNEFTIRQLEAFFGVEE